MINTMADRDDQPWYRDGLRFMCTRCGNCCTGEPGNVWVNDGEIDAIADLRHEPREEVVAVYTSNGPQGRTLREKANGDCVFYERADRKSTRLNSSHIQKSRMPSSA